MAIIPCFLCGTELKQKMSYKKKPYFVCNRCGVQIFVRREQGIENLRALVRTLKGHDFPFREHARVLFEIQAVLAEIRGVKKEIKALDSDFALFASDKDNKDKERTRELLNARVESLLSQLERVARRDAQS